MKGNTYRAVGDIGGVKARRQWKVNELTAKAQRRKGARLISCWLSVVRDPLIWNLKSKILPNPQSLKETQHASLILDSRF